MYTGKTDKKYGVTIKSGKKTDRIRRQIARSEREDDV